MTNCSIIAVISKKKKIKIINFGNFISIIIMGSLGPNLKVIRIGVFAAMYSAGGLGVVGGKMGAVAGGWGVAGVVGVSACLTVWLSDCLTTLLRQITS